MRLHFQGNPQTERQRQVPYCREKNPKRIPVFLNSRTQRFFHLLQITFTDLGTFTSAPVPLQSIHLKPKRDWPTANGSLWTCRMKGTTCQEHPGDSSGPTCSSEVPLAPRTSLMLKQKPEQAHPKHPKGLNLQIFDIFSGKMVMWEGRKLLCTAQEDLPISSCSQGVFHLFNLQGRYWCGMAAASWQWQTELSPDYSTLDATDTQFQWCYFDPASHEPIIRIQKF